jgi:hypothetical protein
METAPYQVDRFERFQALIPRFFTCVKPQGFEIKGGPRYEVGQNPAAFTILALAIMDDWQVWRALLYFAEHYKHVKATPNGDDLPEVRALLRHKEEKPVSSVVSLF